MGKLTSLLKKKISRAGDQSTEMHEGKATSAAGSSSTVSGSSSVETTPASATMATLSLSIPTTIEKRSLDLNASLAQQNQSLSLMDDIMDELAGSTPDTPRHTHKLDLGDCGLAFELSRQLDLRDSQQTDGNVNGDNTRTDPNSCRPLKVGKLDQNSAFKDNAFLRLQQQQRFGPSATANTAKMVTANAIPYRSTVNIYGNSATIDTTTKTTSYNNSTSNNFSSYSRGLLAKEAAEKAEAVTKLREAAKKANAQLPSDDEGSENSDSDESDDVQEALKQRQLVLQQQQQQHEQQQQQQQQQEQNKAGSPHRDGSGKKSRVEDVMDRMKDRHRAVLAEAAAAAREEYYEEYMGEYGQQQQQQLQHLQHTQGPAGYGIQCGLDPNVMYGMDDYRIQQQQHQQQPQQMYYGQNAHLHLQSRSNAQYGHGNVNPAMSGYPYGIHSAIPNYGPTMSQQQQQGPILYTSRGVLPRHKPATSLYDSDSSSAHPSRNPGSALSSRRGCRLQSTLSTRLLEDSPRTESSPVFDSYGGTVDRGSMDLIVESLEDVRELEFEGESTTINNVTDKARTEVGDDLDEVVELLAIAATTVNTDGDKSQLDSVESRELFDQLEPSIKIRAMVDSNNNTKETTVATTAPSSFAPGVHYDNDSSSDTSDDDQPIILSRRGSALGPFLPSMSNIGVTSPRRAEYFEDNLVLPINTQIPYMPHVYQPQATMRGPVNMPYVTQQLQYIPVEYKLPAPQNPEAPNMGHHHSYSVDRGISAMAASGPYPSAASSGAAPIGSTTHMTRMGATFPQTVSRDLRQSVMGPSNNSGASGPGGASASQYPIPATTLLHPLPRRSQSARVRTGPSIKRMDSPSQQQQQQQQQQQNAQQPPVRARGSVEFVRLPTGGYQSVAGPDFGNSPSGNGGAGGPFIRGFMETPISPPQLKQQHQQLISPVAAQNLLEKQYFYMSPPQHSGYHTMHHDDIYMAHSHQQVMQAARR
ncbi:hypothetical protein BGZ58_004869 [Dissophora ornata]|nr:hypothetical protein BGZ58_004869 [Dissophora ornata]